MTNLDFALCTFGMILGTALPRVLPMTLLADRPMPPGVRRWLSFVPAAILSALVAPDIFLHDGALFLSMDNMFLLAALPTILVAWKTRSLFATLAAGMILVALGRLLLGGSL
ncbi:MAG: AzlD domain-containing protein [Desulfovibrionaceae bacterium]|nr:AzlD domain-containing protein [Desulfovibrionaceae bacterium]